MREYLNISFTKMKLSKRKLIFFSRVNDEIGRYYAIIRNLEGTNEKVYIEFYGENGESSGEQHLSHSENYLNEPFHAQHTVRLRISIDYSKC